jgi:hypothetical protein
MTRRDRFRFFLEHAGYSVPPGRAACALALARAEELLNEAEDLGVVTVEWQYDDMPYEQDIVSEDEADRLFESGEWTGPFGCIVETFDGETHTSLWGIVVGPKGTDDPYCRVVAAALASDIEDELRQAVGDARDAAQEVTLS